MTITRKQAASKPPNYQTLIAADLMEVERIFNESLAGYRAPIGTLLDHVQQFRGKRLRPILLLLVAKACGGVRPAHHRLAAATEMIHTATLVHDDVLDEADLRRHVATINSRWGNSVAILLGDMLFTKAFYLASTVDRRACEIIGDATNRVCAGELRQVCERGNLMLTECDYFAIVEGKTAALTECCARLGALYAGADESTSAYLAEYGRHLGIAFQIADDLIDLISTSDQAGKTLGTDLEQLKLTLPILHCLSELPIHEADQLRKALTIPEERVKAARAALEKTSSISNTRRRAEDHSAKARESLDCLPESEAKLLLDQLCDWTTRRYQ